MRDDAVDPEAALLVLLVVGEIAFEGQHVGGDAVEEEPVVADDDGAAGEVERRFLARSVSTSWSLVGSSSSSRLAPLLSIFDRCTRLRSPPESWPTFFC